MLLFLSRCIFRCLCYFFFSSRRRHTRSLRDWSSDVCSSDLLHDAIAALICRSDGVWPASHVATMPSLASLLFTRSMTHPLAERQNGRFHARTACQRERARVKGKGRNGRGQGASEWIPPCGKAREKQLPPGRGGKLAAASRRERFRVCSCSGSFCLAQELAKEWVVEL